MVGGHRNGRRIRRTSRLAPKERELATHKSRLNLNVFSSFMRSKRISVRAEGNRHTQMSASIASNTVSGLFPMNLDGKRPTAGGVPSGGTGQFTRDYRFTMNNIPPHHFHSKSADDWKRFKLHVESCPTHSMNTEGGLAALDDIISDAYDRELRRSSVATARDKLKSELGPREFTLTYSPAWYDTDEAAQTAMRVAIDKLTRYYKDEIHEFRAVGEYTKAGRSHVHCYYLLDGGRKITDKNFKRAWKHWNPRKKMDNGHEGGHHATVRRLADFAGYVEKDLKDAWMNIHIRNADDDSSTLREGDQKELRSTGRSSSPHSQASSV